MEEHHEVADFVVVYTAEAHPTDGWAFEKNVDISQHKDIQERMSAAKELTNLHPLKCQVLVDRMDNRADQDYAASPERLYVVLDGVVAYRGGLGPYDYKLSEVEDFLKNYAKKQ
ncbi:type I iodothyronine deiodinase-like [Macrobrachium rosenbergii]|uniref:type I iodothyronine deiodinase-like n=1 Tax=Macrobrachium rosenbergii TaxID=79674 RepID=UPI0034D50460